MFPMELPKIIGLYGKKQSGKDTTGQYLNEQYNYEMISFAEPLKIACKYIFGLSEEQVNGNLKDIVDNYWGVEPRKILQFVGTDLFKMQIGKLIPNIGEEIWIENIRKYILNKWENDKKSKFVITDVRFQNEADFIKDLDGIIIKIERDNDINDNHISENVVMEYDYLISNNESLDKLYKNIDKIIVGL